MTNAFSPNGKPTANTWKVIFIGQIVAFVIIWLNSPFALLPTPMEVWASFKDLWARGLGAELITSFSLSIKAIAWATGISLLLSYISVVPFFRPVIMLFANMRFLSLVGLSFAFTMIVRNPHQLKISILAFSISVFFVTSMADVLASIPSEHFDLARTLRMKEWRVVWEVVILGQLDKAWDVLRQNAAIGWMMLTTVEGLVRSEGGVGAMLLDQSRHFRLSGIFAIQLTIFLLGLAQYYILGVLKNFFFPYASMTTERK